MKSNEAVAGCTMETENDSHCYSNFLKSVRKNFHFMIQDSTRLFKTNAEALFEVYLNHLPAGSRQHYTCNACKRFVNEYGGLVCILENGEIKSALWDEANTPEFFIPSVAAMKAEVLKSKITGVFLSDTQTLGQPITGEWHHLSIKLPQEMIFTSRLKTPEQAAAEKKEDFRILTAGLNDYPLNAVNQAISLLKTDSLYRSERCLWVAEWLGGLHIKLSDKRNKNYKSNIIWSAAATAPPGFCHVRSSMIGTLLDDIVAGLPFESISRRFSEKMHPLQYQRPQAPPSAGNIKEAEKIVERLGLELAFKRRFARLEELNTMWLPKRNDTPAQAKGFFSHLITKTKKTTVIKVPPVTMTWRKFSETILPYAEKVEYCIKAGKANYSAIVTSVHKEAPPLLQWDREEKRNPFSWYVYVGGSDCSRWRLSPGYCNVTGICLQPSMWDKEHEYPNQGKSVFFIFEGAKDTDSSSIALFPSMLKSELHPIRSTIEAHSKSAKLEGTKEASACGIKLEGSGHWSTTLRVTTSTGTMEYNLDRWD